MIKKILTLAIIMTLLGCDISASQPQLEDKSRKITQIEIDHAEKMYQALISNDIEDIATITNGKLQEDLGQNNLFSNLSSLIPKTPIMNKQQVRLTNHNLLNGDHLVELEYEYEYVNGYIHHVLTYDGKASNGEIKGMSVFYRPK